ncbi:MAG: hypothetical protein ACK5BY_01205 [Limnohabitans sp.]|uniref:hypothetical protein n=1 Tax=Limnohabitans sp. TaxID=1907725 RepID=UPI003919B732
MKRYNLPIAFRSPKDSHFFFGYYDKSPLNRESTRHLAMRVNFIDRQPNVRDIATIGYFDLRSNNFVELSTTNTFNWQQGAMLQWRGPDFTNEIIFNRLAGNSHQSVLLDLNSGSERHLCKAVYSVNQAGTQALCIDFERHYWCRRGYSYDGVENPAKNQPIVPGDGIWILDIENNKPKKLIELDQLLGISPMRSMVGATHYLEHLMFNPSGDKFAFLHRWKPESGGVYTRLYVSGLSQISPRLIDDTGRLTHYSWVDEDHIFGWGARPTFATSLRKSNVIAKLLFKRLLPIYKALVKGNAIDGHSALSRSLTGDSYLLIDVNSGKSSPQFRHVIDRDGHPSPLPNHRGWIVTDTYPDRESKALLLAGNLESQEVVVLDELRSIPSFDNSPYRCDLHPKVSFDGRYISVDTMNDGVRGIYLYELPSKFQIDF